MEILKRKLKENYDFYFVHLLGLDKVGHEYGLGMERLEKLKEIDLLIKDVFNENYNLVIVGDHGMYDVKGTVNVKKEVEKLNTKCLMFLDSSVARFWFLEDKKRVKECLEGLGMKVLEEKDTEKYKVRMKDKRYGELIGICKKGILIFPNNYNEKIVKGEDIKIKVEKIRKNYNLSLLGLAESNIRRQLKRLKDLGLVEKTQEGYRLYENLNLGGIFKERLEKYLIPNIIERVKEYFNSVK